MHIYNVLGPLLGDGSTEMNEIPSLISNLLMARGIACDQGPKSASNK